MYLLVEVFELASGITKEELAFDPDREAEKVGEEQSAVDRDGLPVLVEDQIAPRNQEAQLVHQPEAEREEDERGDEGSVG